MSDYKADIEYFEKKIRNALKSGKVKVAKDAEKRLRLLQDAHNEYLKSKLLKR